MAKSREISQNSLANLKLFEKGKSGNPAGKPKGTISLDTRVRRYLEGDEELPPAIKKTIINAVGADKSALDAIIIVGMLQALQGDATWGKMMKEWGYGKEVEKTELSGPNGAGIPIEVKVSFGK